MSVRSNVKSIQDIMRKDSGVDGDAQRLSQLCWMLFLKIIDDQDNQLAKVHDDYISPIPKRFRWSSWAVGPEQTPSANLVEFINGELFPKLKNIPIYGKWPHRKRVVKAVFEDAFNYMKNGVLIREVANKVNAVDFGNLADRKHFGDIYEQMLNDLQAAGNSGEFYTPRGLTAFMADRIDPKPGEIILDPSCGTGGFLTCAIRHMRDMYVKRPSDEQKMQGGLRAIELKQLPHMLCVTNMLLHGIQDASFVRHDNTLVRDFSSYNLSDQVDVIITNPPFGASVPNGVEDSFPLAYRSKETADLFLVLIIKMLATHGRAAVVLPNGSLSGEGVRARIREHLIKECNLHTIVRLPDSIFKPYANIGTNILFFEKGSPTKDIWFYEHKVPSNQKGYSMTRPVRVEHFDDCVEWWGGSKRMGRVETSEAWKVSVDDVAKRGFSLDFKNPHTEVRKDENLDELLTSLNEADKKVSALMEELKIGLRGVFF